MAARRRASATCANRQVLKESSLLFEQYDVPSTDDYPAALLDVLKYIAPEGTDRSKAVVLLSRHLQLSLAEHALRSGWLELVEGRDLVVDRPRLHAPLAG